MQRRIRIALIASTFLLIINYTSIYYSRYEQIWHAS